MVLIGDIRFYLAALVISLFFIRKPEVIFPLYFISSLSTSYFAVQEGLGAGRYISMVFLLSLIIVSFQKGSIVSRDAKLIPGTIFLIVLTILSTAIGVSRDMTIGVQMVLNIAIFFLFQQIKGIDYQRLLLTLTISVAILTVLVFYQALVNDAFLFEERYRSGEDEVNSNRMAMMMEQCASVLLAASFVVKKPFVRVVLLVLTISSVFVLLATGSRSGLISILGVALFVVLIGFDVNVRRNFILVILVFGAGYYVLTYLQGFSSALLDRFSVANVQESGGTGRLDNATLILTKIFPSHLLFGSGLGGTNMKILGAPYHLDNLAHNIIIDPLTQMGVAIFPFFFIFLWSQMRRVFRQVVKNKEILLLVPASLFVAAVANGIGETIFYERFFWNDMALGLLFCNILDYQNRSVSEVKPRITKNG